MHRDLKPENILISAREKNEKDKEDVLALKITDFGLSVKGYYNADEVGTPTYMAPEIIISDKIADLQKADVWALGVMFD